jgi:hypothetical protein
MGSRRFSKQDGSYKGRPQTAGGNAYPEKAILPEWFGKNRWNFLHA